MLDFIEKFIEENDYSPSLEEIAAGTGLSSLATVHVHLRNLETKKRIRRGWNRSRAIELVDTPQRPNSGNVELPLLGRVAAGIPIEAIAIEETIEVPSQFVKGNETFVLRVQGDSMIEEQIRSGDYIVVEKRDTAINGETVVALVGESETTVKKFYREKNNIRLQPANSTMDPIIVPASECKIQGVVVGLLRNYNR
jgi:repressor LexA